MIAEIVNLKNGKEELVGKLLLDEYDKLPRFKEYIEVGERIFRVFEIFHVTGETEVKSSFTSRYVKLCVTEYNRLGKKGDG